MKLPSSIQNRVSSPPRPLHWRPPRAGLEISLPCHLKRDGIQLRYNRVSSLKTGDVGTSSESSNEVTNVDSIYSPNSIGSPDENNEEELSYASSIKTVASCVIAAVVVDIGVGLKDGIDIGSEFFAGCPTDPSCDIRAFRTSVLI